MDNIRGNFKDLRKILDFRLDFPKKCYICENIILNIKQAGAELGQAQLKLELDLSFT